MRKFERGFKWVGIAATPVLLSLASIAQAQIPTVSAAVTLSGGLYHYNYTFTNNSLNDLFDISIHVPTGPGAILNLSAPTGFVAAYDSGLGLVDFLEDSSTFATGVPVSGFLFDSKVQPGLGTIDALTLDSNGNIVTTSFRGVTATPEPGSIALFGAFITAGAFAIRKARSRKQPNS